MPISDPNQGYITLIDGTTCQGLVAGRCDSAACQTAQNTAVGANANYNADGSLNATGRALDAADGNPIN